MNSNPAASAGGDGAAASTAVDAPPGAPAGSGAARVSSLRRALDSSLAKRLFIAFELICLLLAIRQFQIESPAFLRMVLLAVGAFIVHDFLPRAWRLPFFVLVSGGGILWILGPVNGAWLMGGGLLLIGACHLPISFSKRAAVLIALALGLAAVRAGWVAAPWPQAIWPILGSFFMFRLIAYFYDLKHDQAPTSFWRTLAYFFMLPNICFPIFPVVDFKTFRRSHYDGDPYRIYQVGVDWMARGAVQLLLYRLVYYHIALAPHEISSPAELLQYLVANFLLYLRLSGQFHMIVGILYLFGFKLPETHHRYFLSSSFTDFWRRINIYWKDFMLKVFYYPIYFRIRSWGPVKAMVAATLLVFALTWFFHAYQWFWIRGSFLWTPTDVGFWTILAVLVVVNSLYEAKHGRERSIGKRTLALRASLMIALRTVGTFCAICVLWSFWSAESLSAWLSLWSGAARGLDAGFGWLLALALGAIVLGGLAWVEARWGGPPPRGAKEPPFFRPAAMKTLATVVVLSVLGIPAVYSGLGVQAANVLHSLRSGSLSRLDAAKLERGYYEDLLSVDRFNSQLWEVFMNRPLHWLDPQQSSLLERFTGDFRHKALVPSHVSNSVHGRTSTNRWGQRDKDYEREPAPGTYRAALLGASSVMGWGVADEQVFEWLLEDRLNREHAGKVHARYEILNLAMAGFKPLQQLPVFDEALSFKPTALFYVAGGRELSQAALYLYEVVKRKEEIPYPYLRELAQRAGISPDISETDAMQRLRPSCEELLAWTYAQLIESCRRHQVIPVWIFLPQVRKGEWQQELPVSRRLAAEAGFTVIDMSGVYDEHAIESIRVAEWDDHPNARGHEIVAERLYRELLAKDRELSLGLGSVEAGQPTDPRRKKGNGGD